ncbi:MAG: zf-TFIIB domain-containing protein [Nitrospinae bacterium]|nr:zf-TFIIB domain-containing protein [Nitrospinota bacterium]
MAEKPLSKEEEYFARQEFERKKKTDEDQQQKLAAAERERLRELHHMRCPKCGMHLIEIDFRNIKIDRCSHCDGVWLDAGELDHILTDKSGSFLSFLNVFKG